MGSGETPVRVSASAAIQAAQCIRQVLSAHLSVDDLLEIAWVDRLLDSLPRRLEPAGANLLHCPPAQDAQDPLALVGLARGVLCAIITCTHSACARIQALLTERVGSCKPIAQALTQAMIGALPPGTRVIAMGEVRVAALPATLVFPDVADQLRLANHQVFPAAAGRSGDPILADALATMLCDFHHGSDWGGSALRLRFELAKNGPPRAWFPGFDTLLNRRWSGENYTRMNGEIAAIANLLARLHGALAARGPGHELIVHAATSALASSDPCEVIEISAAALESAGFDYVAYALEGGDLSALFCALDPERWDTLSVVRYSHPDGGGLFHAVLGLYKGERRLARFSVSYPAVVAHERLSGKLELAAQRAGVRVVDLLNHEGTYPVSRDGFAGAHPGIGAQHPWRVVALTLLPEPLATLQDVPPEPDWQAVRGILAAHLHLEPERVGVANTLLFGIRDQEIARAQRYVAGALPPKDGVIDLPAALRESRSPRPGDRSVLVIALCLDDSDLVEWLLVQRRASGAGQSDPSLVAFTPQQREALAVALGTGFAASRLDFEPIARSLSVETLGMPGYLAPI